MYNEIELNILNIFAGERLCLMQSLAGLAAVLSRYSVDPSPVAPRYPTVDPTSYVVQSVIGGIPLVFRPKHNILTINDETRFNDN